MSYIPGTSPARSWRRMNFFDMLLGCVLTVSFVWFCFRAVEVADHNWSWSQLLPYFLSYSNGEWQSGALLKGLYSTLRLGFWSMILALVSGALVGMLSAHQRGFAAAPFRLYIQLLRNTPPLVLLFLVFFFSGSFFTEPLLHLEASLRSAPELVQRLFSLFVAPEGQLDRMAAAVLTLGLYEGAYVAEIVRSGIESVPRTQWEACASQGMTRWQQRRYVIAPQAFRLMLPPLVGQTISTFKDSAIASIISLPELTFQSLEVMAVTRMTFELWISVAALYLLISYCLAKIGVTLEKRQKWRPLV